MKITYLEAEILKDMYRQSSHVLLWPISLAVIGLFLIWYFGYKYGLSENYSNLLILMSGLVLGYCLKQFLMWYKTRYLITNQRLVKIAHDGLFKYTVTETTHNRILNIGYKTTGLVSAIGRFGDVEVQAVGLVEPIVLNKVYHPEKVKDYIWTMHIRHTDTAKSFNDQDISHIQEHIGYTKKDQRIL